MDEKVFTVVVPAYNVQNYVGQCLDSLLRQTCRRFEVIIIDDGSRDERTAEICRGYAERNAGFMTYVRQENKGLGAARNAGLRMVKTPYVTFLDSDDWLDERFADCVIRALEAHGEETVDMVFTLPTVYDALNGQMYDWMDKTLYDEIFTAETRIVDAAEDMRLLELEPNACRRVYRMDFLRENAFEFPEGTRWEDVYPHFYLLSRAGKCLGVPEVGFFYRTNVPTAITASGGASRLEVATVFSKTFEYIEKAGCRSEFYNAALKMCVSFSMWSISLARASVLDELVERLHALFRAVPADRMSAFMKSGILKSRKQKLFAFAVRRKCLHWMLKDYRIPALLKTVARRLKPAGRR